MSSIVSACRRLGLLACVGAFPVLALAQERFSAQGDEYAIIGSLPGDQVFPKIALNAYGGYLVWQDNATDGDGFGISARHINRSLSGSLGVFRVNENGAGDQVDPQVTLLSNGGAVFAWQGAAGSGSKIYARFLGADGTFATGDIPVSASGSQQVTPVLASLPDGNALVVWASAGPDGSMLGVFGQRFTVNGARIGSEFQINQTTLYNQRTPAVVSLPNGNIVVSWVSERLRAQSGDLSGAGGEAYDTDVFIRLYTPAGQALGGEFKVNDAKTRCANPSLSASDDGFLVTWTGRANEATITSALSDGWDIIARPFGIDGQARKAQLTVNSFTYGDQYAPKASYLNGIHMVVWTSLGQDGSVEGVVARLVAPTGDLVSREFRVNSATIGSQLHPSVVANGTQDFLCVWSSFIGGAASFDLFAQRYSISAGSDLGAPPAPYLSALSQTRLSVTWPELSGYTGVNYEIYLDQSSTPVVVTGNQWTASGLQPGSKHSVRLAYRLDSGKRSSLSDATTGQTWGEDSNFDGLPDDWQARYWGSDPSKFPSATEDSDGDGATNLQEFLAGTNPADAASVLRTSMTTSAQGQRLKWNTEPGCIYQVQIAAEALTWENVGTARFAAGKTDSIPATNQTNVALYRVIRLR